MKRRNWAIVVGIVVFALIVWAAWPKNPHYKNGYENLVAKNFEEAVEEFRLCLAKDEGHLDAKALLIHANLRNQIENGEGQWGEQFRVDEDEDETEAVRSYFCNLWSDFWEIHRSPEKLVAHSLDSESRKAREKDIKETRKMIRDGLRKIKVYTKDWAEVQEIVKRQAELLYELPVDPDDDLDQIFHTVSAAVLAKNGNSKAAYDLLKAAIDEPDFAQLFPIARATIEPHLRKELQNEESLLRDKGLYYLQLFALDREIGDFCKDHPDLKKPSKVADFGGERLIWEGYNDIPNIPQYSEFLETFQQGQDFTAVIYDIEQDVDADENCLAWISTYDKKLKQHCFRFYLWDDEKQEWQDLKIEEENKEPNLEFRKRNYILPAVDKDGEGKVAFSVLKVGSEEYTETETRYRTEESWWGDTYRVPYEAEVTRTRPAIQANWSVFELEPEVGKLVFIESIKTVEYDQPFGNAYDEDDYLGE